MIHDRNYVPYSLRIAIFREVRDRGLEPSASLIYLCHPEKLGINVAIHYYHPV